MSKWIINRREFLKTTAASGLSTFIFAGCHQEIGINKGVRFGIVTDSHYADAAPNNNRYYRESIDKMAECVELMNTQRVDFLIELGDFKDQDSNPTEEETISYLLAIENVFQKFNGPTYHVLGNHDMDSISKGQFLENITNTKISNDLTYYSFDCKGFHFIVLDANHLADGTDYDHGNFGWMEAYVSEAELDWLRQDLADTKLPSIVFSHQQLGGPGMTNVSNAESVRSILQESSKVLAGFDGHNHNGGYQIIEGIHYYTLKAVVDGSGEENNSYAIVEVMPDNNIIVTGYRKAISQDFSQV